jgi:hypothetical protein
MESLFPESRLSTRTEFVVAQPTMRVDDLWSPPHTFKCRCKGILKRSQCAPSWLILAPGSDQRCDKCQRTVLKMARFDGVHENPPRPEKRIAFAAGDDFALRSPALSF